MHLKVSTRCVLTHKFLHQEQMAQNNLFVKGAPSTKTQMLPSQRLLILADVAVPMNHGVYRTTPVDARWPEPTDSVYLTSFR